MSFIESVRRIKKKYGLLHGIYVFSVITILYIAYAKFKKSTFEFEDKILDYHNNLINATHTNERAIEIPIIWDMIKDDVNQINSSEILEVGNVMSKYHSFEHTVLDKYENSKGVINEDIVDYKPNKKFRLIFSISTLEHVGFDEERKDPDKIYKSIKNLKSLLTDDGKLIITVPLGYNPHLDKLLQLDKITFNGGAYLMKRVSRSNKWVHVKYHYSFQVKYSESFPPTANELLIGKIF